MGGPGENVSFFLRKSHEESSRRVLQGKPHLEGVESVGVGIEKKITASVPHFTDTTSGSSSGPEPMSNPTLSRVSSTLSSDSLVALFPFDSDIFRPTTMKKENSEKESKKKEETAIALRNPNIVALCPPPRIIPSVSPRKPPGLPKIHGSFGAKVQIKPKSPVVQDLINKLKKMSCAETAEEKSSTQRKEQNADETLPTVPQHILTSPTKDTAPIPHPPKIDFKSINKFETASFV
ncbi:hypothetical protein RB195_002428 [Necator americanus]|uniref:WH2 domain-containing protein n=1 Tax=Necator americanus TaxID=51031 RepID=A0ABR1DJG2_NECAM